MKTYLRILSEASPFGKILPLYLLLTVLYIVFSMVNYSVLIPLLEVLFNQVDLDDIEKMGEIKNFEFSIEYIRNIFYSHFNELIETFIFYFFQKKTYEVKSVENFIEVNKKIKIINILQDKILVKTTK